MTGPSEDPHKKKADEAARYLAESFFGLNMSPADVGGEVLFDDYDDVKKPAVSPLSQVVPDSYESTNSGPAAQEHRPGPSVSSRVTEDDLDDLIVFSDDEDDEDEVEDVVSVTEDDSRRCTNRTSNRQQFQRRLGDLAVNGINQYEYFTHEFWSLLRRTSCQRGIRRA